MPETCAHECADDLEAVLLREGPETVAAVIMEGITGANGVFVPPPGYWRKVRQICDRHGVLLIADEVLSGFGRTGRWFAVDHDDVTPDLLTMAKGLTGGYAPGGAVIVSERIARHFDDHVLQCGLTAYAHPLTCAAIVTAIEIMRDEQLVERAAVLGAWLGERLARLAKTRPLIGDVRGIGMLWALELVVPGAASREPLRGEALVRVAAGLKRRHVHLHRRDNLIYIAPPLVATEADLTEALTLVAAALDEEAPK
jgi:taurine--2-oxoglutarate transaminase